MFLRDNVCTIHAEPYYPAVCRGFPWTDAETGGPYEYDRTICPEFVAVPSWSRSTVPPDRRSFVCFSTAPSASCSRRSAS